VFSFKSEVWREGNNRHPSVLRRGINSSEPKNFEYRSLEAGAEQCETRSARNTEEAFPCPMCSGGIQVPLEMRYALLQRTDGVVRGRKKDDSERKPVCPGLTMRKCGGPSAASNNKHFPRWPLWRIIAAPKTALSWFRSSGTAPSRIDSSAATWQAHAALRPPIRSFLQAEGGGAS